MLLRKLVVVGLVGLFSIAAQTANAQEGPAPAYVGLDRANFADIGAGSGATFNNRFAVNVGPAPEARFMNLSPAPARDEPAQTPDASYEVALHARGVSGFNVSAAQRGRLGFDASGDIARESRSAELRLGRGLTGLRDDAAPTESWYVFVASEDEALIWRPGQRNAFGGAEGGFALQDRVEIGDLQAGVTYEIYGIQASLAYVERTINVSVGTDNFTTEERFAGITLTLRN